jgi:hypothetical protein
MTDHLGAMANGPSSLEFCGPEAPSRQLNLPPSATGSKDWRHAGLVISAVGRVSRTRRLSIGGAQLYE